MKKRIVFACIALFAIATNASSADYYMPAESIAPRFRIEPTFLVIWGGNLQSLTGYSSLVAISDEDLPYATIEDWYDTMLICKVVGWDIRVVYDTNSVPPNGKITKIIPQFEP